MLSNEIGTVQQEVPANVWPDFAETSDCYLSERFMEINTR